MVRQALQQLTELNVIERIQLTRQQLDLLMVRKDSSSSLTFAVDPKAMLIRMEVRLWHNFYGYVSLCRDDLLQLIYSTTICAGFSRILSQYPNQ